MIIQRIGAESMRRVLSRSVRIKAPVRSPRKSLVKAICEVKMIRKGSLQNKTWDDFKSEIQKMKEDASNDLRDHPNGGFRKGR